MEIEQVKPGQQLRIRQKIGRREGDWQTEVTGTVLEVSQRKTGSWYAHAKDNKFWLHRIRLRKADGEITTITWDQSTQIDLLSDASASA